MRSPWFAPLVTFFSPLIVTLAGLPAPADADGVLPYRSGPEPPATELVQVTGDGLLPGSATWLRLLPPHTQGFAGDATPLPFDAQLAPPADVGRFGMDAIGAGRERLPGVTGSAEAVAGCNQPVGTPDLYAMPNDQTLDVSAPGFLGNDIDLDGEALTAVSVEDNVDHGTLAAFADGSFQYTPDPGFTGTDAFAYRMRDASNNSSDPVVVTIEVFPAANRGPLGAADLYTMLGETMLSVGAPGFLGNDIDLDGEAVTAVSIQDNVDHGTLAGFADGSFQYTPDPGFTGTDAFAYRMRDASNNFSDPVVVTIEVYAGNRVPLGVVDAYAAVVNTVLNVAAPGFLGNDIDLDGEALAAVSVQDNVDNGTLAAFADGSFQYTPNPGFTGTDAFAYRMRDASNNFSDPIAVTIEMYAAGTTPVGTPDLYAMPNDQTLDVSAPGFLGNDIDLDGEALTAVSVQDNVDNGTLAAFADGSFQYTPNPGFTGMDAFAYRMRDASNNLSDPVVVTIEVLPPANRVPLGAADLYTMLGETMLSVVAPGFLGNDIDLDGEALSAVSIQDNVDNGTLAAFADGSFQYTPNPGFTGTDAFAYRMRDASNNFSDPIVVTIEVYAGNRVPLGMADAYAAVVNTVLSVAAPGFLGNDIDLDGEALAAVSVQDNVDNGTLAAFADGSFQYTPNPGFTGTDAFAYRMRDASNNFSDPIAVTIDVIDPFAPTVGPVTGPLDPVAAGTEVHLSAELATCVDAAFTATWDWGDGNASAGAVTLAGCAGTVTGSHVYDLPGVYAVTVTVLHASGASGQAVFEFVVVYAMEAGFVTGGGWIDSPAGAFVGDPAAAGRATFGFAARYRKGASVPSGQTQFTFHAALFNFHSAAYEWLVVGGPNAVFKGTGTVNGAGDYGFLLRATDGDVPGGGGVDRLRMKIWDRANGDAVVYDNQIGDPDGDPTDAIEAGSIVVHNLGKMLISEAEAADTPIRAALLPNHPNPFSPSTRIRFDLDAAAAGDVAIEIFDVTGRLVKSYRESYPAPGRYEVVWGGDDSRGGSVPPGVYFYRLTASGFTEMKKMVRVR